MITSPFCSPLGTGANMLHSQAGGIALALSILMARGMGATEFNIYSTALLVATLLAVTIRLRMPTLLVLETAYLM